MLLTARAPFAVSLHAKPPDPQGEPAAMAGAGLVMGRSSSSVPNGPGARRNSCMGHAALCRGPLAHVSVRHGTSPESDGCIAQRYAMTCWRSAGIPMHACVHACMRA